MFFDEVSQMKRSSKVPLLLQPFSPNRTVFAQGPYDADLDVEQIY